MRLILALNRAWLRFTFRGGCASRHCLADLTDLELDCGLKHCFRCNGVA